MKLTPFGFVAFAEDFLQKALSTPPTTGGNWVFQRSVNFSDHTSSLRILLADDTGGSKPRAAIHARKTGSEKEYSIQGWTDFPEGGGKEAFVLKQNDADVAQEEIFDLIDGLLQKIPERDPSIILERPVAEKKPSSFKPLFPDIQSPAPASSAPIAEPEASESTQNPEDFSNTQAFVDALLSGGGDTKEPEAEIPEPPTDGPLLTPDDPAPPLEETAKDKPAKGAKGAKKK